MCLRNKKYPNSLLLRQRFGVFSSFSCLRNKKQAVFLFLRQYSTPAHRESTQGSTSGKHPHRAREGPQGRALGRHSRARTGKHPRTRKVTRRAPGSTRVTLGSTRAAHGKALKAPHREGTQFLRHKNHLWTEYPSTWMALTGVAGHLNWHRPQPTHSASSICGYFRKRTLPS